MSDKEMPGDDNELDNDRYSDAALSSLYSTSKTANDSPDENIDKAILAAAKRELGTAPAAVPAGRYPHRLPQRCC